MQIESFAVAPDQDPIVRQKGPDRRLGTLMADSSLSLERLLVEDGICQRRAARGVRSIQRMQRRAQLRLVISKLFRAGGRRLLGAVSEAVISAVCAGASQGGSAATKAVCAGVSTAGAKANPLYMAADDFDREAQQARNEAAQAGERSADASQWLSSVREMEQRMLSRLENLDRVRHEGIMRASSFE